MSWNPYKRLLNLLPGNPLDVGQVQSVETDGVIIELVSGPLIRARGAASVNDWVYVQDGVILGPAPNLAGETVEV